jgi:hypothetical protein
MPRTDALLTLPPAPRRIWLMSFSIVAGLVLGTAAGALLAFVMAPRYFGAGMVAGLALALPGILRPDAAAPLYRAWNAVTRFYGRSASLLLRALCYYTIFVAVGWTGSSLALSRPASAESLWQVRTGPAGRRYRQQYEARIAAAAGASWIKTYLSWAWESGNIWTVTLVPFLTLLSWIEPEHREPDVPVFNYTLY